MIENTTPQSIQQYVATFEGVSINMDANYWQQVVENFLEQHGDFMRYTEEGDGIVPMPQNDGSVAFFWIGKNGERKGVFSGNAEKDQLPSELLRNGLEIDKEIRLPDGTTVRNDSSTLTLKEGEKTEQLLVDAIRKQLLLVIANEPKNMPTPAYI